MSPTLIDPNPLKRRSLLNLSVQQLTNEWAERFNGAEEIFVADSDERIQASSRAFCGTIEAEIEFAVVRLDGDDDVHTDNVNVVMELHKGRPAVERNSMTQRRDPRRAEEVGAETENVEEKLAVAKGHPHRIRPAKAAGGEGTWKPEDGKSEKQKECSISIESFRARVSINGSLCG